MLYYVIFISAELTASGFRLGVTCEDMFSLCCQVARKSSNHIEQKGREKKMVALTASRIGRREMLKAGNKNVLFNSHNTYVFTVWTR